MTSRGASTCSNAAPTDDPAFHVLQDPRELHAIRDRDWMHGRIIDLERLLPLRPYGAEGRVVFEGARRGCVRGTRTGGHWKRGLKVRRCHAHERLVRR